MSPFEAKSFQNPDTPKQTKKMSTISDCLRILVDDYTIGAFPSKIAIHWSMLLEEVESSKGLDSPEYLAVQKLRDLYREQRQKIDGSCSYTMLYPGYLLEALQLLKDELPIEKFLDWEGRLKDLFTGSRASWVGIPETVAE